MISRHYGERLHAHVLPIITSVVTKLDVDPYFFNNLKKYSRREHSVESADKGRQRFYACLVDSL